MAFVYWIHLPEHTDILSQGYIGITTKSVEERFKGHIKELGRKRSKSIILYRALRKYKEDLVITTLLESTLEYVLFIENKLRPSNKIGWNTIAGGNPPPANSFTQETRDKISKTSLGRVKTSSEIEKLRNAHKGRPRPPHVIKAMNKAITGVPRSLDSINSQKATLKAEPWRNRTAKIDVWLSCEHLYKHFIDGANSLAKLSKISEIPKSSLNCIYKKFKSGWIPSEDAHWLNFKSENLSKENNETS